MAVPSSRPHNKSSSVPAPLAASFMLISCLPYSLTLKMEQACSSATLVDFQRATQCYVSEDRTLQFPSLVAHSTDGHSVSPPLHSIVQGSKVLQNGSTFYHFNSVLYPNTPQGTQTAAASVSLWDGCQQMGTTV
jgi:hypothetical protein